MDTHVKERNAKLKRNDLDNKTAEKDLEEEEMLLKLRNIHSEFEKVQI